MEHKCVCMYMCIHTHTHIYIMEYYLAMRKKILPFVTTWMNFENIKLSEINQTEGQMLHDSIYMKCLKQSNS